MERTAGLTLREQQAVLRLSAAQERLTALQSSGTATTRQLAGAQATLIGAQRSVTKAEEAAAASTSKWRGALAGTLKTAGELGLVLGGIELARKGVELIGGGKELTDALNGVQAAARASDEQMKAARAQAIGLGQDLQGPEGATAIDAAQAMDDLVRSGMTLDRAMAATRPTLLLAAAANVSTADAARYLGDVLDDFALPASHATHVANSLAGAATSAGGGLTEMFEAIKYAGPTSRAVGIDVDSLTAAVAELAKGGIQGSMAGTGIRMMLVGLTKESPAAVKALRDLGVVAFDAQGRFKGLPVVIDQLHRAQERMDPKSFLSAINTAFGARASTIVASFAHRGVAGYDQFLARVKSGDVEKYAALMNRGAAAGFRQIGKEAAAGGIAVYQKFEPAIATAVSWVGEKLPGAVRAAQSMLGPFEHFIGGALTEAWHLFGGAAQFAGAVLGPVVRLLDDMKTPLGGTATLLLGAYAGFRLFSAVPGLLEGVYLKLLYARDGLVGFATTAKTTATSFVASSTGIGAAATATAAEVGTAGEAATIGWAGVLGPIGAIAVGIGLLSSLFGHNSDEAEKNKAAMQGYAQSLKQSSDLLANVNLEQTQKVLTDGAREPAGRPGQRRRSPAARAGHRAADPLQLQGDRLVQGVEAGARGPAGRAQQADAGAEAVHRQAVRREGHLRLPGEAPDEDRRQQRPGDREDRPA
jgi:TP901 family phage tail tape measure protein